MPWPASDLRPRGRTPALLLAAALWAPLAAAPAAAAKVPDVALSGFQRPDARLSDFAGRVVVLHFWATWCPPCLREMESIEAFYAERYPELAERGLVLLTVSNDVRMKDLRRFHERTHPSYPIYKDPLSRLHGELGLVGHPATLVIGRDGEVLDRLFGSHDWSDPSFRARIERYVAP